jgi:peptidoglycan/xylan/chitin deacetylase (PgdA/CDA1 family)
VKNSKINFTPPSAGTALILTYHRVTEGSSDSWSLCVTPKHFTEQLEVLRKIAYPLELQRLREAFEKGNPIPRRSVVITFDDGYADNLHNAHPILEQYGVPATIFLVSGYIGRDGMLWWDELESLFLQPGTLPESLSLAIDGTTRTLELGESSRYSEEECLRNRGWKAWEQPPSPRHSTYYSVWQTLRPLSETDRQIKLEELRSWSGRSGNKSGEGMLSIQEVSALSRCPLIELGSHTITHPRLSAIANEAQRQEIEGSKIALEEMIGHPVKSFAYPYGGSEDYTTETRTAVQKAGFTCACSTISDVVREGNDLFQLPRFQVGDWDGDEFSKRVVNWFETGREVPGLS